MKCLGFSWIMLIVHWFPCQVRSHHGVTSGHHAALWVLAGRTRDQSPVAVGLYRCCYKVTIESKWGWVGKASCHWGVAFLLPPMYTVFLHWNSVLSSLFSQGSLLIHLLLFLSIILALEGGCPWTSPNSFELLHPSELPPTGSHLLIFTTVSDKLSATITSVWGRIYWVSSIGASEHIQ